MMSQLSAVWLLLAAGAAIELYDELPPAERDNEMSYQEDNNIDAMPRVASQAQAQVDEAEAARLRELLLYRLLESQLRDEIRKAERREQKELQVAKTATNSLAKRLAQTDRSRQQQRWKSKKGRGVGTQMVCYFKLCAFRNPV